MSVCLSKSTRERATARVFDLGVFGTGNSKKVCQFIHQQAEYKIFGWKL